MKFFAYCLASLVLFFPVTQALAQQSIAVVDVRLLLSESKAAKNIQGQIKKHRDAFVATLAKEEKELRSLEKALIEEKGSLSKEEFVKKRDAFEGKLLKTRKDAESKRRKLEAGSAKASQKLRDEITKVVQKIADEKKFDLVVSMQNIVVGSNELNISKEALAALDKSVKKIPVDVK